MKRHGCEPAAFCAGLVYLALAAVFFLDAAGVWNMAPRWSAPLAAGGLALAAVAAAAVRTVRGRRRYRIGGAGPR